MTLLWDVLYICTFKSLYVFMGTKTPEKGKKRKKLHNYILLIKHSWQRVPNSSIFIKTLGRCFPPHTPRHVFQILSTPSPRLQPLLSLLFLLSFFFD